MIDPTIFFSGRVLGVAGFLCAIVVIMAVTVFGNGQTGQGAQKEKSHEVHLTKIK